MRPEPSTRTGPRLLKPAKAFVPDTAPIENVASKIAGGFWTVLQFGPRLPAEATTKIPEAWAFSTIVFSVSCAQPSAGGQFQLLFITWGRRVGSGLWPWRFVGAMKNWKHSM
jgi:hypothetical protein